MSRMIQIRNVPEPLHRKLKVRAAMAGMSLSDYLMSEIRKSTEKPTSEEMLERLRRRGRVNVTESPVDAVRAERQSR